MVDPVSTPKPKQSSRWRLGALLLAGTLIVLLLQAVFLWWWLEVELVRAHDNTLLVSISMPGSNPEVAIAEAFPTASPRPTNTLAPTDTPVPTASPSFPTPGPTQTPFIIIATPSPAPTTVSTVAPTQTPWVITATPEPTATPTEVPTRDPNAANEASTASAAVQPAPQQPQPASFAIIPPTPAPPSARPAQTERVAQSFAPPPPTAPDQPLRPTVDPNRNPNPSNVVGTGTPGSCTEAAFANAAAIGGKISFSCGPNPVTIFISRPIHFIYDADINGGGKVILDGRRATGIISSEPFLNLKFRNLTFQNGVTQGQGGAIDLGYWSHLDVINSQFYSNQALKQSAACDGGGAIFIGGGSTAHIENSRFENNRGMNGGAINNLRSGLTIINSVFNNNHATHSDYINQFGDCGGGGAVYVDATRKSQHGGPDNIIMRGNIFTNNSSNNHGGALFIAVHTGEKVEIGFSTFENNRVTKVGSMPTSGTGGAIWYGKAIGTAVNNNFVIYNSSFMNNHADTQGGGVWMSIPATIRNSTFVGNTAINPAQMGPDDWRKGNGGGIAIAHQVLLILESSTLVGNRAGFNGGGIVGENVAARNTIFANNKGDWYTGLQQNCTHSVQNWGGNLQYLEGHEQADHRHWSNCGSSVVLSDPMFAPLNNGVLPLQTGSPAIDAADASTCPSIDQRGIARPQGNGCDIGAYEANR